MIAEVLEIGPHLAGALITFFICRSTRGCVLGDAARLIMSILNPEISDETAKKIFTAGVTTLAKMTHEAECAEDDLMFIAIINEAQLRERERPGFMKIYRDEYMRVWPEMHKKYA